MISEKTVELNVTAELMAWFSYVTRRPHCALAPSQRAEGRLGYDVAVGGKGGGVLIQFKRAYVDKGVWTWHINHTKKQDQHARLQQLERAGFAVYYAFPHFHLPDEVLAYRKKLLPRVFWYRPLLINPPGGPIGEHDLRYEPATGRWWINPEPMDLDGPEPFDSLIEVIESTSQRGDLESLIAAANHIMFDYDTVRGDSEADDSVAMGQLVLMQTSDNGPVRHT